MSAYRMDFLVEEKNRQYHGIKVRSNMNAYRMDFLVEENRQHNGIKVRSNRGILYERI